MLLCGWMFIKNDIARLHHGLGFCPLGTVHDVKLLPQMCTCTVIFNCLAFSLSTQKQSVSSHHIHAINSAAQLPGLTLAPTFPAKRQRVLVRHTVSCIPNVNAPNRLAAVVSWDRFVRAFGFSQGLRLTDAAGQGYCQLANGRP